MSEPRITERAQADLEEIWAYLARRNPEKADQTTDQIVEGCRARVPHPLTGRNRDDLGPGLRSFVVKPYVIFFRPVADTIEIVRVLHGSRDIDTIMATESAGDD